MNLFLIAWVSDMPIIDSDETYPMFQSPAPFLFYHHFSSRLSMFFMGSHDLLEHGSISGATLLRKTNCSGSHHPVAPSLGWASWVPPFLSLGGVDLVQQLIRPLSLLLLLTWGDPHHLWLSNRSAPLPQHGWALGEVLLSHVRHHLTLRALARASVTLLCWMSAV